MKIINREHWLTEASAGLAPVLAEAGLKTPAKLRVTCGFPSKGALAQGAGKVIGQCWYPTNSKDKTTELMVSPVLSDPVRVIGVLAHELVHASLKPGIGHGKPFADAVKAIGLEGKPTATTEGEAFKQRVAKLLAKLGPYPHANLDAIKGQKKQSTRLIKVVCFPCATEGEDYIVRMSAKTIARGCPSCPEGHEMEVGS